MISISVFNHSIDLTILCNLLVLSSLIRRRPIAPYNSLTPAVLLLVFVLLGVFLWVIEFLVHSLSRLEYLYIIPMNSAAPSICFQINKDWLRLWETGLQCLEKNNAGFVIQGYKWLRWEHFYLKIWSSIRCKIYLFC